MRTDLHVHLDKIGGLHRTPPPTVEEFRSYVARDAITVVGGIYEDVDTPAGFATEGLDIIPIYWERNPLRPTIPSAAEAIKLHPFLDGYQLSEENVGEVFQVAQSRGLPILIHSEDRMPDMARGRLFARLAKVYPQTKIIIAHSGSYAPPTDPKQHTETAVGSSLVRELVNEAIDAALQNQNVYLEVSILASAEKARLLATRAPLDRILLGSDFPIRSDSCGSVRFQELALRRAGLSQRQIEQIHENAKGLWVRLKGKTHL